MARAASATPGATTDAEASSEATLAAEVHTLSTGHKLVLDGDQVMLADPHGAVQVRIRVQADGPVVELSGAVLELDAVEDLRVRCQSLDIAARGDARMVAEGTLHLGSEGEMTLESTLDMRATAACIWLN